MNRPMPHNDSYAGGIPLDQAGGVATGEAPGRVNLIGEHTDYHEGFVLPTIIPQRTHVTMTARQDARVRVRSNAVGGDWEEYRLGEEREGRGWLDYVAGVTSLLTRDGVMIPGLDVDVTSRIPIGAGVSSSAALTVSTLRALRSLLALELDDIQLALIARRVETEFVGAPVGVMDQMAASLGVDGEALFIDTRTLHTRTVPIPRSIDLIVIHSGLTHAHADGAYKTRREESFRAAHLLGLQCLRDADRTWLPRIERLPPVLARRARHIVTENARVLEAVSALRDADTSRLGALFAASHASMRDDYEISLPEIDTLVSIGTAHPHVHGARLTGGGFGGSVVMLARSGCGRNAAEMVLASYRHATGQDGRIIVPEFADGNPSDGHGSWTWNGHEAGGPQDRYF
jgi:galactokinase